MFSSPSSLNLLSFCTREVRPSLTHKIKTIYTALLISGKIITGRSKPYGIINTIKYWLIPNPSRKRSTEGDSTELVLKKLISSIDALFNALIAIMMEYLIVNNA